MTEDFLHFIWQFQYFDRENLKTSQNQSLRVLEIGSRNWHAGADFYFTKILLDQTEWVGNVEIHIKSSDWKLHQHQNNEAYNNVVLHVVWEDDFTARRTDGTLIPTLALKHRVNLRWLDKYKQLIHNQELIPCSSQIKTVDNLKKIMMLDKALSQRLESKALLVNQLWEQNQNDWEETTYQLLAKNFGFKVNSEAFLRLAQNLPLKILLKHQDNLLQMEALLFGQAGFLEKVDIQDEYYRFLQKEYAYLAQKYQLFENRLALSEWKFLRMRPANFPSIRLAQFASLIHQKPHLFSFFTQAEGQTLSKMLKIKQSEYWQNHYLFGKKANSKIPSLGQSAIENILVNTVVPLLAAYSKAKSQQDGMDKALQILENLPSEDNKILKMWAELGLKVKTAFDSQALLELYNQFCLPKKCLSCVIGQSLVKS
jgi:hypothetical protein